MPLKYGAFAHYSILNANVINKSMRAKTFVAEQLLDELAMNPTSLRSMAAQTNAMVGMEFEMYVPDVAGESSGNEEWEPDYDMDTSVSDFDDIISFFDNGEWVDNSHRQLMLFKEKMYEQYETWLEDQVNNGWKKEGKDTIRDYIVNNNLWDEDEAITLALEEMGLTDDEKNRAEQVGAQLNARKYNRVKGEVSYKGDDEKHWDEAQDKANQSLEEKVDDEWMGEGTIHDEAFEEYKDEERESFSERDFLREIEVNSALDAYHYFDPRDISWPHMVNIGGSGEGSQDADDIARDFEKMIGRPVMNSDNYHGVKRNGVSYIVEPDSSLDEPDNREDAGLEFVSPPLPLNDMLSDLKKVKAWCNDHECYTNSSTGLHINISVPGMDQEGKLDYVKLALLMGDKHVIDQFGRAGNTYAKSAMDMIKTAVRTHPESAAAMLTKMKGGLDKLASKIIHTGKTEKYTSINNKGNYIEFRSPGDDWLHKYYDKIEPTVLRLAVALDAACDPEKSRKEYLKKLYTLLTPTSSSDPLAYFAQYAAGEIPKAALRSFIKQVQLTRKTKREEEQFGPITTWTVTDNVYGYVKGVKARTAAEAIAATKLLLGGDSVNAPDSQFTAVQKVPQQAPALPTASQNLEGRPWHRWYINVVGGDRIPVSARSHGEAESQLHNLGIAPDHVLSIVLDDGNLRPPQPEPQRREETDFGEDVPWEIYNRATGARMFVSFMAQANNPQLAAHEAVARLNDWGIPQDERRGLGVRMVGGV
jgi:hypothetical protein